MPVQGPRSPAEQWGVQARYRDAGGRWQEAPAGTVDAILASMGANDGYPPPDPSIRVLFARDFSDVTEAGRRVGGQLTLEDGATVTLHPGDKLPAGTPFGYHHWSGDDGTEATVVVSPRSCRLPTNAPAWGWAVQLYALRSERSWGVGDLGDLGDLARWSARDLGAGLVLINPLHAAGPALPQDPSPYFPSSRQFRNPLYLRVEDVAGAGPLDGGTAELASAGRGLNAHRHIDRDAVFRLKMKALSALWDGFAGDADFDRYRAEQGPALAAYAAFCVLAEHHGNCWRQWPAAYRHPDSPHVAEMRAGNERRALFHEWLQWLLDRQLHHASEEIAVVHDLAVGFQPDGADAWLWQDSLAPAMAIGAPPDAFNTGGQNWGLPPFDPWRLRAAGYAPFIETIRAALCHAGGLRLDHVMGLFRLYWIPEGAHAGAGAYVRYPASDLLDIVALESHRAGAYVVGEDLGTVEEEVRAELAERNILSYRLLWFEDGRPAEYPVRALSAVTTHDLPTVAGLWTGSDLAAQQRLGMEPNEAGAGALRERLKVVAGVDEHSPVDVVVAATYAALGQAPSMLLAATLDDALVVEERPNMPGTVEGWPNWSLALPVTLEDIRHDPRVAAVAGVLRR